MGTPKGGSPIKSFVRVIFHKYCFLSEEFPEEFTVFDFYKLNYLMQLGGGLPVPGFFLAAGGNLF